MSNLESQFRFYDYDNKVCEAERVREESKMREEEKRKGTVNDFFTMKLTSSRRTNATQVFL